MTKPQVTCHMVTTIDGKILGNRWPKIGALNGSANLFETTALEFKIPYWIVGTKTMTEFSDKPFKLKKANRKIDRKADHIANPKPKSLAIAVDTRGRTFWKKNEVGGDHVVLLLTEQVSEDYLAHLQDAKVSYFICGKKTVDLKLALHKLATIFKLKKVMLHGGGLMNGTFLKEGLIDQISQLIVPVADGGQGVSSIFDIPGKAPEKAGAGLKLLWHKKRPGDVNWFLYKVIARPLEK